MAIIYCGCAKSSLGARHQEEMYGEGKRVCNRMPDKDGRKRHRCTCCGKVHEG